MNIIQAKNYNDLSRKAANIVSAQVILKPQSVLGLATGSTPIGSYKQLVEWHQKGDIDFSKVKTVNLDEYCGLSGEHPQSYRYFMNEHLFHKINILMENTYVPNGMAKEVYEECHRYDTLITDLGGIDLQILGIGHNGHIGFNEPSNSFVKNTHCVTLDETTREANARFFNSIDEVPTHALTMGVGMIMQAKKILLIANGQDKEDILQKALFGPISPEVPASILQIHHDITVICAK